MIMNGDKDDEEVNQYHSEEINPIMTLARCLLLRQKLTFSPLVDISTSKYVSAYFCILLTKSWRHD